MMTATDKTTRIFVVDEDQTTAATLGLILKMHWYGATVFFRSIDAFHAVKEQAPDLIIAAVVMPQMTGLRLALRILDEHRPCKVLLLSSHVEPCAQILEARERGFEIEVLNKPVDPGVLIQRVERLLSSGSDI